MSKTPGEYEPRKPLSKEERQARKERQEAEARMATAENAKAAEAFARNRERLRAEWLAREAGANPPTKNRLKATISAEDDYRLK